MSSGSPNASASEPVTEPDAERERTMLEALARALDLETGGLSVAATLKQGTLLAPRSAVVPPTRSGPTRAATEPLALPPLDVAAAGTTTRADLELVRALGAGGMGVVWLARQRSLAREVAVKLLHGGGLDTQGRAALLDEARVTGALQHPSVVPVYALGVDAEGAPLLVMKRIEGDSFAALLRDPRHPAWHDLERRHGDRLGATVEILMRVADALHFAHARGFVHRDVKPDNVMIGGFGEVYLVDWGIALRPADLAEAERELVGIVGTPAYMAPEMVRGDGSALDARTDVYLLGATLHVAITGTPRHPGERLAEVLLVALASQPVAYEDVPEELGALANRATHPVPAERPESALAFREALGDFLRHRSSARLTSEARRDLDALALDGGHQPTAALLATPASAQRLASARFGFTQALREWSGNAAARQGLDTTLRWMTEAELERRSPDAAEALVRELATVDESLLARVVALRETLLESRRLEERARRDARERDPRVTARQRAMVSVGLILATSVLVALGWRSEVGSLGGRPMSEALTYDAALLGFMVGLVALFRKTLLANRLGRQTTGVLLGVLSAGTVSDVLMWARGADTHAAGSASMLVMASVLAGAALGVHRRLAWSAAAFLAGAILCALVPSWNVLAMGASAILAAGVVLTDSISHARSA